MYLKVMLFTFDLFCWHIVHFAGIFVFHFNLSIDFFLNFINIFTLCLFNHFVNRGSDVCFLFF